MEESQNHVIDSKNIDGSFLKIPDKPNSAAIHYATIEGQDCFLTLGPEIRTEEEGKHERILIAVMVSQFGKELGGSYVWLKYSDESVRKSTGDTWPQDLYMEAKIGTSLRKLCKLIKQLHDDPESAVVDYRKSKAAEKAA